MANCLRKPIVDRDRDEMVVCCFLLHVASTIGVLAKKNKETKNRNTARQQSIIKQISNRNKPKNHIDFNICLNNSMSTNQQ
jgi:hypothetical protein